jgi:DNA polymerase/3'-5' exonuclease PolX
MDRYLATEIAERVRATLAPYCTRIEIAGSIRRRRPQVHDIEIVAIPQRVCVQVDLFTRGEVVHPTFCQLVARWPALKGRADGRYTQRRLPEGIALDLFMPRPESWGLILAVRTGSSVYSHEILAKGWVAAGYHSVDGVLRRGHLSVHVPEERDLFALIGLPWCEPWEREM